MKIMTLIIIKFFVVMEIISHYEAVAEVIQSRKNFIQIGLLRFFQSLAMTGMNYFLAMIMAKILFLVFGIILIMAFYLIEKIILKNFNQGEER